MLAELKNDLRATINREKAAFFPRFFKAGPGQYAEGDKFLGVTVPKQRKVAKKYKDLPLGDIKKLIQSSWHEERLTGLFILIHQFLKANEPGKKEIYDFYISHTTSINNWDLVDSSAGYIVGGYLADKPEKMIVLRKLAHSELLWDRRIAMIATLRFIVEGQANEALEIAEVLLHDKHDLIQKAVGWMLREVGKRCHDDRCPARIAVLRHPVRVQRSNHTSHLRSVAAPCAASPENDLRCTRKILVSFLAKHYKTMPRTTLRYAIEHFDALTRSKYLKGEV